MMVSKKVSVTVENVPVETKRTEIALKTTKEIKMRGKEQIVECDKK